jgi:hypothetical protein
LIYLSKRQSRISALIDRFFVLLLSATGVFLQAQTIADPGIFFSNKKIRKIEFYNYSIDRWEWIL